MRCTNTTGNQIIYLRKKKYLLFIFHCVARIDKTLFPLISAISMFAEFIYDYFSSQMNFTHQNIDEWWAKIETFENEHVLLLFRMAPRNRVSLESGHIVVRVSKTSLMMNRNRNIRETMCILVWHDAHWTTGKLSCVSFRFSRSKMNLYSLIVFKPFIWENVV